MRRLSILILSVAFAFGAVSRLALAQDPKKEDSKKEQKKDEKKDEKKEQKK